MIFSIKPQSRVKFFSSAFLAAILWGFVAIPLRAIQAWPAADILYCRILVSAALTWLFIIVFRRGRLQTDIQHFRQLPLGRRKSLLWLMFAASVLIMGNWFTFIYAVNHVSIQSAAFAYLVCPLLTTLAGFLILGETLSIVKKVSIGIALVSVAMLARGSFYELCWSLGIASLYALYLITQRIIQQVDKLNVLAVQLTICSLLIIPFIRVQQHPLPLESEFWFNIFIIAAVFTIIPLYMSMYALNGVSSSTVGVLTYINPIVAFGVAVLYFDEQINAQQFLAYAILMAAVFLFNWATLRKVLHKFA